jgi:hypothetical protein
MVTIRTYGSARTFANEAEMYEAITGRKSTVIKPTPQDEKCKSKGKGNGGRGK